MSTTSIYVTLNHLHCAGCGMVFGVTADFMRKRRDDHAEFKCPSGCTNYYPHQSDKERAEQAAKRAQELLEAKRREAESLAEQLRLEKLFAKRSKAKLKGDLTKLRNRVTNGMCPCCNRFFKNLHNHMKSEHPAEIEKSATPTQETT